ncbi:MAG TPA: hypothetical protein VMU16_15300 [Candidatus Binataceae bacterium]|nr:hypothetical protein [Candidatus Binataceae bacterium]
MREKQAADFKSVAEVAEHVEKLVDGWASVIRCKAGDLGGSPCSRIVMLVFRDFYRPLISADMEEWDSSLPLVCDRCADSLEMLNLAPLQQADS